MKTEYNIGADGVYFSLSHTPSLSARATYFYVQGVGHYRCDGSYYTKREGYRSFLLACTLGGKGYLNYREKSHELRRGQAFLIDCYEYQEYYADKTELWDMKWLHFNGCGSEGYFNTIYENYGPVIDLGSSDLIPDYIDAVMELIKSGDIQFEIKASEIIVKILTEILLKAANLTGDNNRIRRNSLMDSVLEYIEENYSDDITLQDMAQIACSSVFHFSRVFKKYTGYSAYEYLIKYRLNKAKNMLVATDHTVDEIAESVGFKSTSNFIKTFREIEEITPLKYRKFWRE